MAAIEQFLKGLSAIPEKDFTHSNVLEYLRANQVDPSTLSPYLYFSKEHYTRNLIDKRDLYELIAICWDVGQKSPIHNHRDQRCWMAMAYGKLQVHNFKLIGKNEGNHFCELKSSEIFTIEPGKPAEVDPEEPIHQVLNLPSYGSRAVSLHIYSLPFDTCEVYDLKAKRYDDMPLINTTEYGVLKSDLPVEKITL